MVKKKLLLTGSSGMVGKNILEHPMALDWDILAPSSSDLNLTKTADVSDYVARHQPYIIIHTAGLVGGIQANLESPVAFLEQNVVMGRNIIMASYQQRVKRFLNLGSTCMYPTSAANPLDEGMILTSALEPSNEGYAIAKIFSARLCEYIVREDNSMNYKTIIPCNIFGRHDKFDPTKSHLLPAIIHKIHNAKIDNQKSVEIWGDGLARREFMFASDLASAVFKAASDMGKMPDLMNCGLGQDYTVNEYYKMVADVIKWDGDFTYNLSKPVGMKQKLCSTKLLTQWGWTAPTSIQDGIMAAYDFYLNRGK
ncbi:NAD-dependent epimerase/dehydratase family protein [Amylibacter sp.]|nr:NAD-dependent epimerase/dehydratase family protein [Amylibacter sp.]MDC1489173.1 NAD-dependent epimerase/dehydratase family protein [Amylibacter sp.]